MRKSALVINLRDEVENDPFTNGNQKYREGIPSIAFNKTTLTQYLKKIESGAIKPSSKRLAKWTANPRIHIRATKDDLVFVDYGRVAGKRGPTARTLGSFKEWSKRKNWLEELKSGKSLAKILNPSFIIEKGKPDAQPLDESSETMENLLPQYFASEAIKKNKSRRNQINIIKNHFLSEFGTRHVASISKAELVAWRDATVKGQNKFQLKKTKEAKKRGKKSRHTGSIDVANKALSTLSGGITYLEDSGIIETGVFPRIKKLADPKSQREPLPPFQLRTLWEVAAEIKNQRVGDIIRLLILTGQRKDAIAGLKWSDLSLDKTGQPWLTVPTERSKGGHEYSIPICQNAVNILTKYNDGEDGLIFPTRTSYVKPDSHHKRQVDTIMRQKMERAGRLADYDPSWKLHNVRKNIRNILSANGVTDRVAELITGHKLQGITGSELRYLTRNFNPEMIRASKTTAPIIYELCVGDWESVIEKNIDPKGAPLRENLHKLIT